MAIGRVNTGGGGGLNFSVVGGTSQPTGKENLIWVNTSNAITDWVFSADEPTGAEGRIWFGTNILGNSGFNALKRNQLLVYPVSCRQYVDGAWVAKEAVIFRDNAWFTLSAFIFNNGNITGANWIFNPGNSPSNTQTVNQTISIHIIPYYNGVYMPVSCCDMAFDLSPYSKIRFDVAIAKPAQYSSYPFYFGVINVVDTENTNYTAQTAVSTAGRAFVDVDISSLNGYYHPKFTCVGSVANTGNDIEIYSIQLIP